MPKIINGGAHMKRIAWMMVPVLACVLAGFLCPRGYAQEKVMALNFSDMQPADNKISIYMGQWCKEVEKRTNGKIKITHFPNSTLTPAPQTYAAVIKGIADLGFSFPSYTKGRFPLTEVIDLPLGYKKVAVGGRMVNEYYKKFKPKEFDEVKVLFLYTTQPHHMFTKVPVNNLEDFKGLKMRTSGTTAAVTKALGGLPVAMPITDAYDSLSKGVVNGISINYEPMKGWKLAEVVSHCTEYASEYAHAYYMVMNKNKWNALSPDTQKIIEKINEEWIEGFGPLWDDLEKEGKEVFTQRGGKTIVLSKQEDARWTERLRPVLDDYVQDMKSKGLPGQEALKFCVDYLKAHQ
jgi:TRAP-type transport system periplasmic protein